MSKKKWKTSNTLALFTNPDKTLSTLAYIGPGSIDTLLPIATNVRILFTFVYLHLAICSCVSWLAHTRPDLITGVKTIIGTFTFIRAFYSPTAKDAFWKQNIELRLLNAVKGLYQFYRERNTLNTYIHVSKHIYRSTNNIPVNLPTHVLSASILYPGRQEHWKLPTVFVHFWWQTFWLHSSMSETYNQVVYNRKITFSCGIICKDKTKISSLNKQIHKLYRTFW